MALRPRARGLMDMALASGAGGCGFESRRAHQKFGGDLFASGFLVWWEENATGRQRRPRRGRER